MILSSKKQFVPSYLSGDKQHSFRQDRRWRKGMSIQHYVNTRTKDMHKFMKDSVCTDVFHASIFYDQDKGLQVVIDMTVYSGNAVEIIARNDGFKSSKEFTEFFFPDHWIGGLKSWEGVLIHWTENRYHYAGDKLCFDDLPF